MTIRSSYLPLLLSFFAVSGCELIDIDPDCFTNPEDCGSGDDDDDDDDDADTKSDFPLTGCSLSEVTGTGSELASYAYPSGSTSLCKCETTVSDPMKYDVGRVTVLASGARAKQVGASTPWYGSIDKRTPNGSPYQSVHNALATSSAVSVAGTYTYYLSKLDHGGTEIACSDYGTITWDIPIDSGPSPMPPPPQQQQDGTEENAASCVPGEVTSLPYRLTWAPGVDGLVPVPLEEGRFGGAHIARLELVDARGFASVSVEGAAGVQSLTEGEAIDFSAGEVALGNARFDAAGSDAVGFPIVRIDTTCAPNQQPAQIVARSFVIDGSQVPGLGGGRLKLRLLEGQGQADLQIELDGMGHRASAGLQAIGPDRFAFDLSDAHTQWDAFGTVERLPDSLVLHLEQVRAQGVELGAFDFVAHPYGQ